MKPVLEIIQNSDRHWVGDGFPVQSVLSYHERGTAISPFLLLDYAAPFVFSPTDKPRGVGQHPHRGFETVTIVYQGALAHRDSAGHSGVIGPGDVQWMTAASGVLHEEFHEPEFARRGGAFQVVQLWVNLPAKHKMSPPRYQTLLTADIPSVALPNGAGMARIIAGALGNTRGPARTFTPIELWDLRLKSGARVELPISDGHMAGALVLSGRLQFEAAPLVGEADFALFDRRGEGVGMVADMDSSVLFFGGEPIQEPIVGRGPFVMNTAQEIQQAMWDFQNGRMGIIPILV